MLQRAEITKKTIKRTALMVLAEVYKAYGPNRVRLSDVTLNEMKKEGLINDG